MKPSDHSFEEHYIHGSQPEEQIRLSKLNKILNEKCLAEMQIKGGDNILDIGSGLGQFTREMAKAAGGISFVLGIERDSFQLNKAKDFAQLENEENLVHFRQGNAYDLPISKNENHFFDIVHSRFVLEHLTAPSKAIEQMKLALKPGGRLILCDDDHSTFRPTPEPVGFSVIWNAYSRSYDRLGCDPFIGRNLNSYLVAAGLKLKKVTEIFFGACQGEEKFKLVADNLIGILEGAKDLMLKEKLISESSFNSSIEGLKNWRELPDATLWYSIPWVEAG